MSQHSSKERQHHGTATGTRQSELGAATVLMLNRRGGFSIDKARTALGHIPLVDVAEGMRRSAEWARAEALV